VTSGATGNHERHNREFWDADADAYQAAHGEQLARGATWGVWGIPESDLDVLGATRGRDVLELGCGAAQWSLALARDGARCIGLDQSAAQLRHARRAQHDAGIAFPLLCASGEAVPLESASFDVVFCDHGVFSFCDPDRAVSEAARLLRRGGLLAFNHSTLLHTLCWDAKTETVSKKLHLPYFGAREFDWGDGTVDFHLTYGEWIRCFARHDLGVDDLIELEPPSTPTTTYDSYVDPKWAARWPAEEIWKVRKR
jgi:SAM-dependent methyltransferase